MSEPKGVAVSPGEGAQEGSGGVALPQSGSSSGSAVEGGSGAPSDPVADALEDFKPADGELVVPPAGDENTLFRVLDRHDEAQILDELQERVLDTTLYDFGSGQNRQTDLSYVGVREVVHRMNHTGKVRIRVRPGTLTVEEIEEDGEQYYRATVWAEDTVTGFSAPGASHQPKRMKLKPATAKRWREDGKHVPEDLKVWDEFAYAKAVNKASRNALKTFVPEFIRQALIAQYLKQPDRVRTIKAGAGAEAMAELPPPLTDERSERQRERCRGLVAEIRGVHPTEHILPGQFNAMLTRAEWSHDRLDELVETLEGMLERARAGAA